MLSTSPRATFFEWAQVALLAANLTWTTLCLGGFRAETMVVTSVLTAALAVVHGASRWVAVRGLGRRGGKGDDPGGPGQYPAAAWLIPFLVYAAANVVWVTPVPWLGWVDWFGWVQATVVFGVVAGGITSPAPRAVVGSVLLALALGGVVLEAYQFFVRPDWLMLGRIQVDQYLGRASGPFGIPNSMAALLLLLLPACAALALRRTAQAPARVFFGWVVAVLLFGLGLTISRGAWIGFAGALACWPLLRSERRWSWRLGRAGVMLGVVVAIGALAFVGSARVRGRVTQLYHEAGERSRPVLWRAGLAMVKGAPVLGTGAGSFNVEFEHHRPEGFLNEPIWAHNDYLNTLSDYGVLGVTLLLGGVAGVIWHRRGDRRRPSDARTHGEGTGVGRGSVAHRVKPWDDPLVAQAQAIGLLAFALQLFVDFHFKVPALAMAFAAVAGLAVGSRGGASGHKDNHEGGVWCSRATLEGGVGALLVVGGVAVAIFMVPQYRAEAWRERARERIDALRDVEPTSAYYAERVALARAELDRAAALNPGNGRVWSDRAYAAAQQSLVEPAATRALGRAAEGDADRALALSDRMAEFWIRRGVARDMQGRYAEAGDDFTRAVQLAPKTPLPWYHYAYHLSLRAGSLDMAEGMLATCLRLDPQNREAVRLRHQLATGRARP